MNQPAAQRPRRSRIGYAFGLLALFGAATALVVIARYPALSSTQPPSEPVPAPEITVVGEGTAPPDEPEERGWAGAPDGGRLDRQARADAEPGPDESGGAAGQGTLADAPAGSNGVRTDDISRSLFCSGLLGLAISLAGLGLVGTRRRQW